MNLARRVPEEDLYLLQLWLQRDKVMFIWPPEGDSKTPDSGNSLYFGENVNAALHVAVHPPGSIRSEACMFFGLRAGNFGCGGRLQQSWALPVTCFL